MLCIKRLRSLNAKQLCRFIPKCSKSQYLLDCIASFIDILKLTPPKKKKKSRIEVLSKNTFWQNAKIHFCWRWVQYLICDCTKHSKTVSITAMFASVSVVIYVVNIQTNSCWYCASVSGERRVFCIVWAWKVAICILRFESNHRWKI